MAGDRVKVDVSPYDLTKGRIVTRITGKENQNQEENKDKGKKNKTNSVNKHNYKSKPK